jgi:predicted nucleic acid-binding protein
MYLLDTNVVSEMRKIRSGKADPNVSSWAHGVEASDLYLSVISIHELELGVLLAERRDAPQGRVLRKWLTDHALPAFADRILDVDTAVARRSAKLHVPDPLPFRDGLIAATALIHGMTVVTRNIDDFQRMGVPILNPWDLSWQRSTS